MSWIHPSFDDFSGARRQNTLPKMSDLVHDDIKISTQLVWCDEYEPKNKKDLAVNLKKVQEVEVWLLNALRGRYGRAPIALLSGPSGSGKTATLKVLSKCVGFTIKEWVTPGKSMIVREDSEGHVSMWYESQLAQFEEYLFRASRYTSVVFPLDLPKFVILVEDIPNVYINDTTLLEKTLRKYTEFGFCPLIFVCSTGSPEFNLERIIFKEKLLKSLNITKFSFNPVSKRMLSIALTRITLEGRKKHEMFRKVDKKFIEIVAEMSNSDIRSAVNQFQYLLSGKMVRMKKTEEPKHKSGPPVGRDEFHDVFRHLGRVLYCKKLEVPDKETGFVKRRLLYDPAEIVGSVSSIPNLFLTLLNENYINIFTDMKKIAQATDIITCSNVLMSNWRDRDIAITYSLYLSVLGLMNCSNAGIKKRWHPFKGSKLNQATAAYEEKKGQCMLYFPEKLSEGKSLMTDILPYYAKMDLSGLKEDKKKFIMSFSRWKPSRFKISRSDSEDEIVQEVHESYEPSSSGFRDYSSVPKDAIDVVSNFYGPRVKIEKVDEYSTFTSLELEEVPVIEEYESD